MSGISGHTFLAPNEIEDDIALSADDADYRAIFLSTIALELEIITCEKCRRDLIDARNAVLGTVGTA